MTDAPPAPVGLETGCLSLAEKLALLHQHAPALPRLGLSAFSTGAEGLHGVAWLGVATTFPQAVGLGATWDCDLLERIGTVVSTELRARHAADPSVSLNVWAPVVNPLRHPRWGRNEEGFAEDPHLVADLATAYALGLRGPDPAHWRAAPTLKHVIGYGYETERHLRSTTLRPRVLHEYELAAFRKPLAAGVVGALMPSYNLVNGRPAHLAAEILDILRGESPHPVVVVSDAYAPGNIAGDQGYCDDHAVGFSAALRAGVDSFTQDDRDPGPTLARLRSGLDRGLLTEADVDRAVERLLWLRRVLGLVGQGSGGVPFDQGPYASIGPDAIDLPGHRALAREAATKAVVVARNDGLLPLDRDASVAVIGPLGDRVLMDWYSGTPPYRVSLAAGLAAQLASGPPTVVDGADVISLGLDDGRVLVVGENAGLSPADGPAAGVTVTDWGHDLVTLGVGGRLLTAEHDSVLRATAEAPHGWEVQESFRLDRTADGLSFFHLGSASWVGLDDDSRLSIGAPSPVRFLATVLHDGLAAAVRTAAAADVAVVALGNDPHLLGRETEDRPDLLLPGRQAELLRRVRAANPQTVLAIVSSYPYVLDPVQRRTPAIVWSSHAGQELGHGLADVLLGRAEPSGRFPQTWPADQDDAGDLFDADIISTGATAWYASRPPLFGLGHGLTFTTLAYGPAELRETDDGTAVRVEVTNTGARIGHELVQVYASRPDLRDHPRRLVGYRRVSVPVGGSCVVEAPLALDHLAIWDVRDERHRVLPGRYELAVGSSVSDVRTVVDLEVSAEPLAARRLCEVGFAATGVDRWSGATLVPRDPLIGEVVRPNGTRVARLVFEEVVADGTGRIAVDVRLAEGVPARVRAGLTAFGPWVPVTGPTGTWRRLTVPLAGAPTSGDLVIELSGPVELDRVSAWTTRPTR
ncbi:MAG TPA: glycoside hydrolase family 3 C-terminal domain-containing protein [Microlunatus sp.]